MPLCLTGGACSSTLSCLALKDMGCFTLELPLTSMDIKTAELSCYSGLLVSGMIQKRTIYLHGNCSNTEEFLSCLI